MVRFWLLAARGLDRKHGIAFIIPDEVRALIPVDCGPEAVIEAMRFLTDDWLCDVKTSYIGKCIAIAAALTMIERSVIPNRPVFTFTAPKRGGGEDDLRVGSAVRVVGGTCQRAAESPQFGARKIPHFGGGGRGPAQFGEQELAKQYGLRTGEHVAIKHLILSYEPQRAGTLARQLEPWFAGLSRRTTRREKALGAQPR